MAKLKKKAARADKRARNEARRERGLTGRGARPTSLSAVQLVLMGKGLARSFTPYREQR